MSSRYQHGSLRREKRAAGDVWVWRYRVRGVMKQETNPVAGYKNKTAMWGHLEPSVCALNGRAPDPVKIAPTLIEVIDRYKNGELPQLEKTTQDLYTGFMDNHLEPRGGSTPLTGSELEQCSGG